MKDLGISFGYSSCLLESKADCDFILSKLPEKIGILGFDTETNTRIDMSKKDNDNINIKHDMPFMLQFGYDKQIFIIDFRTFPDISTALETFDKVRKKAALAIAHNIKFDMSMLMNIGYSWTEPHNECDLMSIARLALEAKSEREGGYPMGLKPLAARLLGTEYALMGSQVDNELRGLWHKALKELEKKLKPYKISRSQINEIVKDVTGTLDMFPEDVQKIWNTWELSTKISYADVPIETIHKYGATDVILVLMLTKMLLPVVKDRNQLAILKRERALIMPLIRMERAGYTIDKPYLIRSKQALIFEVNAIKDINNKLLGENIAPNQHQAIKDALLRKFKYTLESTDKNQMDIIIATDKTMPEEVKKYLNNVIYLRTLEKWLSTYINPMLHKLNNTSDTKVYTQYNANGAVSGRFTSNFQQFPKNAVVSHLGNFELFHPRKMFVPDSINGELAYIDYSQVELRLQAEYTYYATGGYGDENMLRAYMPFHCYEKDGKFFHNEDKEEWQGVDLHTQSTKMAFPTVEVGTPEFKKLRNIGKRVNFALIYGASLKKVQMTLADVDPKIVEKLYRGFHSRFIHVKTYQNFVSRNWVKNGGYVTNLLGRRYYIVDQADVYKLNNYLIQGSAADIIKTVIIKVDDYLRKNHFKTRLIGCIHDELCISVAPGEHAVLKKIKWLMENSVKTYVPLVAEVSTSTTNWAEKKEVEL